MPGATVTLTNIDTGETKDFVTNQDGIYDTVSTPAGNYSITFTAKGFKKAGGWPDPAASRSDHRERRPCNWER